MQIERTGGFDPFAAAEGAKTPRPAAENPAPRSAEAPAPEVPEAVLEPLARQAAEAPAVRADKVAEARRLIAEGKLDTPEAAQRVAENLLKFGI